MVCVAVYDGRIVGFALAGADRQTDLGYIGELYALYVLPEIQSRGVGTRLLRNPSRHCYARMGGLLLSEERREVGGTPVLELAYGWRDIEKLLASAGSGS